MSDQHLAKYKEKFSGVTKDGHQMFLADIVNELNRKSFLESYKLEADSRIKELKEELNSHKAQIDVYRDGIKKCFPSLLACDGVLMVKADDYNQMVSMINVLTSGGEL